MPLQPTKTDYLGPDNIEIPELKASAWDVYTTERKAATKRFAKYDDEIKSMFAVIIGQLDRGILDSLKSEATFDNLLMMKDTIKLIVLLRNLCYRENNAKVAIADDYYNKLTRLLTMKQDQHDDTAAFADKVKMRYDVFKAAGGSFITPSLIEYALVRNKDFKLSISEFSELSGSNPSEAAIVDKVHKAAEEIMLATIMVKNCNQKLYNNIDENLRMDFAKGMDNKPMTVTDAQETLNQFRKAKNQQPRNPYPNPNQNQQTRNPNPNPNPNQNPNQNQNQHKGGIGPFNNYPIKKEEKDYNPQTADASKRSAAHQLLLKGGDDIYSGSGAGFIFTQVAAHTPSNILKENAVIKNDHKHDDLNYLMDVTKAEDFVSAQHDIAINPLWILLDSQASCNIICNPDMVCDIMKEPNGESITLHCNAGVMVIDTIATLPGFGTVWFYADGIANILSLACVSDKYRITMDTKKEQAFLVHKPDGSTRKFKRTTYNLYACNIAEATNNDPIIETKNNDIEINKEMMKEYQENFHVTKNNNNNNYDPDDNPIAPTKNQGVNALLLSGKFEECGHTESEYLQYKNGHEEAKRTRDG
jgi:hypothetical protein